MPDETPSMFGSPSNPATPSIGAASSYDAIPSDDVTNNFDGRAWVTGEYTADYYPNTIITCKVINGTKTDVCHIEPEPAKHYRATISVVHNSLSGEVRHQNTSQNLEWTGDVDAQPTLPEQNVESIVHLDDGGALIAARCLINMIEIEDPDPSLFTPGFDCDRAFRGDVITTKVDLTGSTIRPAWSITTGERYISDKGNLEQMSINEDGTIFQLDGLEESLAGGDDSLRLSLTSSLVLFSPESLGSLPAQFPLC